MGAGEDELIGIPFPEHSSELLSSLNEQRHRGVLCDVTIVTQGLEYRTHRAVLAACSQYFRKLFTSKPFSGPRNVCELDFVKPEVLAALLEFAYTATLTISSSNMREVLQASRLLEIQCVADACADILRSSGEDEHPPADYQAEAYPEPRPPSPVCLVEELPKARPRKRPKKKPPRVSLGNRGGLYRIVQPLRASMSDGLEERPPSPARLEDGYPPLPEEEEEEEEGVGEDFEVAAFLPPPSPPLEGPGLDPAAYLASLSNGLLGGDLGSPDKLVRRRKSQMPQECPICHKVIHGAGKLPRHMRTHTGEKPFACEVCGVRFTRNDKLKIHMRKHTGERPYCCNCCDARFLHSYDLKNHARLHTGDRPFECSQCRKAFVRLDHLQRHLKGQNCLEVRTRRRKGADQSPPLNGGLPEDCGEERPLPGLEAGFPQEYGVGGEPALLLDRTFDPDVLPDWGHVSTTWDQEACSPSFGS